MRGAVLGLCLTACSVAPVPTTAPKPTPTAVKVRPSPGVASYWTRSHLYVEQQVSEQVQESRLDLGYFLTARLEQDSTDLQATLVLDSVTRYEGTAALATDFRRARGATFVGRLTEDGRLAEFRGGDSSVQFIREMTDELQRFFPGLPPDGAAPGAEWVDTTQQRSVSSGVPLVIRSIAHHQVGEVESRGSEPMLPIRSRVTYDFDGAGTQGGQAFRVDGSGHRVTAEFMSLSGRYLGLVATDSSSFTITISASGLQIQGRQTRSDTVSVVP